MGLAERREIKRLQDEVLPVQEKELQSITGSDTKYDIDWQSFSENMTAMSRFESFAFKNINETFRSLCSDEMGREAVQESIKTIHISNHADASFENVRLTDGTLDIPWDWAGWGGSFYPSSLTEKLEKAL